MPKPHQVVGNKRNYRGERHHWKAIAKISTDNNRRNPTSYLLLEHRDHSGVAAQPVGLLLQKMEAPKCKRVSIQGAGLFWGLHAETHGTAPLVPIGDGARTPSTTGMGWYGMVFDKAVEPRATKFVVANVWQTQSNKEASYIHCRDFASSTHSRSASYAETRCSTRHIYRTLPTIWTWKIVGTL